MKSEAGDFLWNDWRHLAVIAPCHYGRQGLMTALRSRSWILPERRIIHGFSSVQEALDNTRNRTSDKVPAPTGTTISWDGLIVHLPGDPLVSLALLLQLGALMGELMGASPSGVGLTVLSHFSAGEVRRVLRRAGVENPLRVVDDRLPVATLCAVVAGSGNHRWEGTHPVTRFQPRLSEKEREVLVSSLQGISVQEQACRRALNSKTVYGQRQSALHKLGAATLPGLLKRFRSCRPVLVRSGQCRDEGRYASAG